MRDIVQASASASERHARYKMLGHAPCWCFDATSNSQALLNMPVPVPVSAVSRLPKGAINPEGSVMSPTTSQLQSSSVCPCQEEIKAEHAALVPHVQT